MHGCVLAAWDGVVTSIVLVGRGTNWMAIDIASDGYMHDAMLSVNYGAPNLMT